MLLPFATGNMQCDLHIFGVSYLTLVVLTFSAINIDAVWLQFAIGIIIYMRGARNTKRKNKEDQGYRSQ